MGAPKKGFNKYKIEGDITIVYLYNRKGDEFECLIDTKNLQKLIDLDLSYSAGYSDHNDTYYALCTEYLGRENGKSKVKMHRMHTDLISAPKGYKIDHENHNGLDNREDNLRVSKSGENSRNRKGANKNSGTGIRNVNWGWNRESYFVQFMKDGERYAWEFPLDQFEQACIFAEQKRKELFGEFAGL